MANSELKILMNKSDVERKENCGSVPQSLRSITTLMGPLKM